MGYGESGLGTIGYGMDFPPVPQAKGCNPLLRDPFGVFWALGITNNGSLTITKSFLATNRQVNPIIGPDILNAFQLSVTANEHIQSAKVVPPTIQAPQAYIPLLSPAGGAFQLIVDKQGDLITLPTDTLLVDIIPYVPDVAMSVYGNTPGLICFTCGNASVTASADLSLWCCSCNSFVLPEDTSVIVILDE